VVSGFGSGCRAGIGTLARLDDTSVLATGGGLRGLFDAEGLTPLAPLCLVSLERG
jgi:hypothetical protein